MNYGFAARKEAAMKVIRVPGFVMTFLGMTK